MIINPLNQDGTYFDRDLRGYSFRNVYLHGELEDMFGFDLCGIDINPNKLSEGIHPCEVRGVNVNCTLFLWKSSITNENQGLVVINGDVASWAYANNCFNNKVDSL